MKKAQVQFMEMIFVLLILVVIIMVGMIIYYSFLNKGLKEKGVRFTDIDAIILTDSVSSMAELTQETGVINSIKIFSFARILNQQEYKDYYRSFFSNKKVTLEIVYPPVNGATSNPQSEKDCTLLGSDGFNVFYIDNQCQKFTIYDSGKPQGFTGTEVRENPVSVYYPLTNEYKIGILRIEVYKFD